jgi:hypothetical protein
MESNAGSFMDDGDDLSTKMAIWRRCFLYWLDTLILLFIKELYPRRRVYVEIPKPSRVELR